MVDKAKVWCVQYETPEGIFTDYVIAEDWPDAQRSAKPGHTVIGELVCVIPADSRRGEVGPGAIMAEILSKETIH